MWKNTNIALSHTAGARLQAYNLFIGRVLYFLYRTQMTTFFISRVHFKNDTMFYFWAYIWDNSFDYFMKTGQFYFLKYIQLFGHHYIIYLYNVCR